MQRYRVKSTSLKPSLDISSSISGILPPSQWRTWTLEFIALVFEFLCHNLHGLMHLSK
jgi:hypothetical protein